MKTDAITTACNGLVDVVGNLTIEVHIRFGISAEIVRAACGTLAQVLVTMTKFGIEFARRGLEPVDPEIKIVLTRVLGRLQIAHDEHGGIDIDPVLVSECCEDVAGVHSMLRALACVVRAADRDGKRRPDSAPPGPVRARHPFEKTNGRLVTSR